MSHAIWKYPVHATDGFTHLMPKGAQVLALQLQRGEPQMWASVDTTAELETRAFRVYGTGHALKDDTPRRYIGTFQLANGVLIFHVFEEAR